MSIADYEKNMSVADRIFYRTLESVVYAVLGICTLMDHLERSLSDKERFQTAVDQHYTRRERDKDGC